MKLFAWVPRPSSWASGVALYAFAHVVALMMAFVLPLLFDVMPRSPRLGWLGVLIVWLAPVGIAALAHRVAHGWLDRVDPNGASVAHGWASLWAGLVAWANTILVSTTTGLVMIVLDPPPVDPDASLRGLLTLLTRDASGALRLAIWIVLATYVYELQRLAGLRAKA